MRVALVAVGRLKDGPERELAARYRERALALGRGVGLHPLEVVELPEDRARQGHARAEAEAARLLAHPAVADAVLVAFDERGRCDWSSERLAAAVAGWRDAGRPGLALAIGGADGLGEAVRARAERVLAFGALTLPHQLVRVLVLEQLYRTMTLLSGHPYHRGEP